MSEWTPERVELLKKLYEDGNSFSEIASTLGGTTRGAVGGKLNRLGLTIGKSKTGGAGELMVARQRTHANQLAGLQFAKRQNAKRQENSVAARSFRETKAQELRAQFEAVEITDLPPDQSAFAVSFSNLTNNKCKYPVSGDARDLGAMLFCGDVQHPDHSYCARHCRIAYRPRYSGVAG